MRSSCVTIAMTHRFFQSLIGHTKSLAVWGDEYRWPPSWSLYSSQTTSTSRSMYPSQKPYPSQSMSSRHSMLPPHSMSPLQLICWPLQTIWQTQEIPQSQLISSLQTMLPAQSIWPGHSLHQAVANNVITAKDVTIAKEVTVAKDVILTLKLEIRGRLRKWFCIPVLKKPLHITVHREISPQIDEVVLCGHRHYAKIFPVSNWLLEIHGLGGPWAADTSNGCFQPQPMQNSVLSGRLLAALHPGCATLVPSIFFRQVVLFWAAVDPEEIIIGEASANSFSRRDSAAALAPSLARRPRAHKKVFTF